MAPTAIYLRISLDRTGEELAVQRQEEACRALAAREGLTIVKVYTDNDISASDSRKSRPAYDQMIKDYELGRFDVLICWDLDRLTRQPRQLEDWIDRAEQRGLRVVTTNGEADLATDGGRMYARIKAAVARAEIERKSARQKAANRQRAKSGQPPATKRLTGYAMDGTLIPEESTVVRELFDRFAEGESLSGLARDLNERGVPTVSGKPWIAPTIRGMLTNPRYAGAAVYRGEVLEGVVGSWETLVSRDDFDAAQLRLNDPRRKTNRHGDTSRKHLGSGVYVCGTEGCGRPLHSGHNGRGQLRYTCPDGHLSRLGDPIDDFVLAVIRGRLGMSDLHDLLVKPADESRLKELNGRVSSLTQRLAKFDSDYREGLIDARERREAREHVNSQITILDRERLQLLSRDKALGKVLNAPDPVAAFNHSTKDIQRRVVKFLLDVTVLPWPRGIKGFDPSSVRLTWR